jgi:hypothetical protein
MFRSRRRERQNLAAERSADEGTGGVVGGIERKLQELSESCGTRKPVANACQDVVYLLIVKKQSDEAMERAARLAPEEEQKQ